MSSLKTSSSHCSIVNCAPKNMLSIFTPDCVLYTVKIVDVETILKLHTHTEKSM